MVIQTRGRRGNKTFLIRSDESKIFGLIIKLEGLLNHCW